MPEFGIGRLFHISFGLGRKKDTTTTVVEPPGWLKWQADREDLWAQASADKEVYAVRQFCPYKCGWWTMAVEDPSRIDIANASITVDTMRHIKQDCPNAPADAKAKIKSGLKPSH